MIGEERRKGLAAGFLASLALHLLAASTQVRTSA